ncbi:hypothetical protein APA_5015 [Pseudanabaena sp. lw0831]|nr:hypothetical protein APA_5015 [Pseudanabaena sp. lw0831]
MLPGTTNKFACGGLWAELKTLELAKKFCAAEVVTYRQREKDYLWLDDLLDSDDTFRALDDAIFVMSWGFDVVKLAPKLKRLNAIYHAHSAGYGFNLPSSVPIITVSRNTLGYWGQRSPHSLIYYLPNEISNKFQNQENSHWSDRDIDVLVQARKSSSYLMKQLIPALQKQCRVEIVDRYVEDLEGLFNRTKVYLYDSAEYWAVQNVTEGFGLQPMEALACGCQVFSSVNHGLSDYLDPAFNCYKIAGYSQEFDMQRILRVIQTNQKLSLSPTVLDEYRAENIIMRLQVILEELNEFFDHKQIYQGNISSLGYWQVMKLRSQRIWTKLLKRLNP